MPKSTRDHLALIQFTAKWALLTIPLAILVGSSVAFFLHALEWATQARWENPSLLYFLPVAGIFIVWVYHRFGGDSDGGNNLILDQIHEPGGGGRVPRRMAPLVLFGTVATHLFGGSAGREGTAVQMGGSIASGLDRYFRLGPDGHRILLTCGVASGFGAVFGTPITGAIFALEVLAIGRMRLQALVPALFAALMGDMVCHYWNAPHTYYQIATDITAGGEGPIFAIHGPLALKVLLAAIIFGLVAKLFSETCHGVQGLFRRHVKAYWLRPVVAAVLLIGLTWILGTRDYLGLGVETADGTGVSILNAFNEGGADPFSWFWKLLFTAITLGAGFKGGEVTPLFFVGATLGNTMAWILDAPVELFAAIGFIAVFAGATNTPLACTIMGVELFGAEYLHYFALACFVAYIASGHSGIYLSQRVVVGKGGTPVQGESSTTLRHLRQRHRKKD